MKDDKDILNSGRRDKIEIRAAIVALTLKPFKAWQISRQMHLNQQQTKQHVIFMINKNLIEKRRADTRSKKTIYEYYATEKGHQFLKKYCDNLRLLYGEDYLRKSKNNLATTCLQYNKETKQAKAHQLLGTTPII